MDVIINSIVELKDPITLEIMSDPVILEPCKHTVDKKTVLQWLEQKCICPSCNKPVTNRDCLQRNFRVYNIISILYPDIASKEHITQPPKKNF